jgi:hypothetical protein|nr:MAG TPA_asm: zinc-ribbon domain protein [Caudoviricetes sp.]
MIVRCSRCGKIIENTFVRLESSIIVSNITPDGLIENCNNMKESTAELLCGNCFNDYCDCLNQLNEKYDKEALNVVVDIVDDIQYSPSTWDTEDLAKMVEVVDDEDIVYDSENS